MTEPDEASAPSTLGRVSALVAFTVLVVLGLVLAGRGLLASDEDPAVGLVEQAAFRRLIAIPADAEVLVEPAWAATFYGTILIRPNQAADVLPGGERFAGDSTTPNAPAFSYREFTSEGGLTCLVHADIHDARHPSPLVPLEQLDATLRAAFEAGQVVIANVGAICGAEDQFPDR